MHESENDALIDSFLKFIGAQKHPSFTGLDAEGNPVHVVWVDRSGWRDFRDRKLTNHLIEKEAAELWHRSQLPE